MVMSESRFGASCGWLCVRPLRAISSWVLKPHCMPGLLMRRQREVDRNRRGRHCSDPKSLWLAMLDSLEATGMWLGVRDGHLIIGINK